MSTTVQLAFTLLIFASLNKYVHHQGVKSWPCTLLAALSRGTKWAAIPSQASSHPSRYPCLTVRNPLAISGTATSKLEPSNDVDAAYTNPKGLVRASLDAYLG